MLELLGFAWSVWKLGVKRVGPYGAVAVAAVVGFVLLRGYLEEEYPGVAERLEAAV